MSLANGVCISKWDPLCPAAAAGGEWGARGRECLQRNQMRADRDSKSGFPTLFSPHPAKLRDSLLCDF